MFYICSFGRGEAMLFDVANRGDTATRAPCAPRAESHFATTVGHVARMEGARASIRVTGGVPRWARSCPGPGTAKLLQYNDFLALSRCPGGVGFGTPGRRRSAGLAQLHGAFEVDGDELRDAAFG